MSELALQGSLLDQVEEVGVRPLVGAVRRTELTRGAWVDLRPGFITGADELFTRLNLGGSAGVDWQGERRVMWEKEVDTPRLLRFYRGDETWPDPVMREAQDVLSRYYFPELGENGGRKRDLVGYYRTVALGVDDSGDGPLMRATRDRPTFLQRFPDGIDGDEIPALHPGLDRRRSRGSG